MTKLLDRALEAARHLPSDAQDDIARVILRLAGADDEPPVPLTPEEQAAIAASKAAAARGEFATEEQVRAVWAKHGL
jgi:predicted transcriptional regulator